MNILLANKYLTLVSRLILGVVFIVASIEKIAIPIDFAASVQAYQMVPLFLVNIFALILPWMELICGLFILAGVLVRPSSVILSALLLIFILGIGTALIRDLNIDCGCFGSAHSTPIGGQKLLEDAVLFLLALHLYYFPKSAMAVGE